MDKNNKKIIIQETKCTCKACGNVWFYGKEEIAQNASNSIDSLRNKALLQSFELNLI